MNAEQASKLLVGLGDTSRKVAAALKVEGIKGRKKAAMYCPISMYLKMHGARRVGTSPSMASFDEGSQEYSVELPVAVKKFIISFDQGRYPALIEK